MVDLIKGLLYGKTGKAWLAAIVAKFIGLLLGLAVAKVPALATLVTPDLVATITNFVVEIILAISAFFVNERLGKILDALHKTIETKVGSEVADKLENILSGK